MLARGNCMRLLCGARPLAAEGWEAGVRVGPFTGRLNPFLRSWALLVERGRPRPRSTYRVNLRMKGPKRPLVRPMVPLGPMTPSPS